MHSNLFLYDMQGHQPSSLLNSPLLKRWRVVRPAQSAVKLWMNVQDAHDKVLVRSGRCVCQASPTFGLTLTYEAEHAGSHQCCLSNQVRHECCNRTWSTLHMQPDTWAVTATVVQMSQTTFCCAAEAHATLHVHQSQPRPLHTNSCHE